jgi:hypothetical protein
MRIPSGRKVLLPSPIDLPKRGEGGTVIMEGDDDEIFGVEEEY